MKNKPGFVATQPAPSRGQQPLHTNEPGCAVLKAVATGAIAAGHHVNFVKLRRESDYSQMSYAEKRQKDKNFGKYVKSVKKDLERD